MTATPLVPAPLRLQADCQRPAAVALAKEEAGQRRRVAWLTLIVLCAPALLPVARAQSATTRLRIISAEYHNPTTAADLQTLRTVARSRDTDSARLAIRALGRLNRAAVIPDLIAALRHPLAEARAEAADALAQATRSLKTPTAGPNGLASIQTALLNRLSADNDASVRGTVAEALARLPYRDADEVARSAAAIVALAGRATTAMDRLGAAKALEAMTRLQSGIRPADSQVLAALALLAQHDLPGRASLRDERVRRLALQGLVNAGAVEPAVVEATATDPDAQVRRLAMTAAAASSAVRVTLLADGTLDPAPMVRIAALRGLARREAEDSCATAVRAVTDSDMGVALVALDLLAPCGSSTVAVAALERAVGEQRELAVTRGWHRQAHALVALATAAPDRAAAALPVYLEAPIWQVRAYAARAARLLGDRAALERLAADADDNVREAAVNGLQEQVGHDADAVYVSQLTRSGYQVVRAAALALDGTPNRSDAVPALEAALDRLVKEKRDNSFDARAALTKTLTSLGAKVPPMTASRPVAGPELTANELRRLASPRARITIRDVGRFEIALFTAQAPATVLRFARLAASGYYNGLSFHRIVPNFVIQGGSPGANEYIGDGPYMRDELGLWPHVRGTVGVSTRGRDTGDAQIFINLVDNPRLDHEFTVFGQVLTGLEVVDRILEGDIIESIDILP